MKSLSYGFGVILWCLAGTAEGQVVTRAEKAGGKAREESWGFRAEVGIVPAAAGGGKEPRPGDRKVEGSAAEEMLHPTRFPAAPAGRTPLQFWDLDSSFPGVRMGGRPEELLARLEPELAG